MCVIELLTVDCYHADLQSMALSAQARFLAEWLSENEVDDIDSINECQDVKDMKIKLRFSAEAAMSELLDHQA